MTESIIDCAKNVYERFLGGDIPGFLEMLSDDAEIVCPGNRDHIPWAGTWIGKQGCGELLGILDTVVQIEFSEASRFVAESADTVVVLGADRVRARKTSLVHEGQWVHELTFRAGKLQRFVEHYDTDSLATAIAG